MFFFGPHINLYKMLRFFPNTMRYIQALKTGIQFSSLLPQKSFSGIMKRPFAYLPKLGMILIAEPKGNKIGIYNAKTLNFHCWMVNPDPTKGTRFECPNCFLIVSNGNLFLLEENQMTILNPDCAPSQRPFTGRFVGLVEDYSGSVLTIEIPKAHQKPLAFRKLEMTASLYQWTNYEK